MQGVDPAEILLRLFCNGTYTDIFAWVQTHLICVDNFESPCFEPLYILHYYYT